MKNFFAILFFLSFNATHEVFGQKQKPNTQQLTIEEQWLKDSIDLDTKYKKKWIKDSIEWEKVNKKKAESRDNLYNERWNPKDSLSYVDNKAAFLFTKNSIENLNTLAFVINSNFSNPLHKARVIYYWICTNIKYDSASLIADTVKYYNNLEKDATQTFQLKRGVCAHYSSFFQYLGQLTGLESIIINGYSKVYPNKYVSPKIDHAWNAVKIKNQWKLIDATWGVYKAANPETFWFDTPAEKFIYSHFPTDSTFQFLKKKISLTYFQLKPIVEKTFYLSKIPTLIPEIGYFSNQNGVLLLEAANTKKKFDFNFTAFPVSIGDSKRFSERDNWIQVSYKVKNSSRKGYSLIEVTTPGKGSWWIKIDIIETIWQDGNKIEIEFPRAMIFQVATL